MPASPLSATLPDITEEAVARIRSVIEPEQVILFVSWARGEAGPDSDLDVLVIAPFEGPRHETGRALLRALIDLPAPTDVAVLTPDEWETWRSVPGTLAYPAHREGVVLYEA